jgi:acylphosphatase
MRRVVHVLVAGRVQGVGYRAFVEREAVARDLGGWVRNRRDGAVEAVFAGEADIVEAMLAACRAGPRHALVESVDIEAWTGEVPDGPFLIAPSA